MAAVYKSLSKPDKKDEHKGAGGKKNKQRVLILSSRGVTHRYAGNILRSSFFIIAKHFNYGCFQGKANQTILPRHRHLMNDLYSLLPHSRKDAKLDTKTKLYQLNELAELYNCNNVFFFEARKGKDLYAWVSKAPNGPTVKMHLQNCE